MIDSKMSMAPHKLAHRLLWFVELMLAFKAARRVRMSSRLQLAAASRLLFTADAVAAR
jgi:hypothetical protein